MYHHNKKLNQLLQALILHSVFCFTRLILSNDFLCNVNGYKLYPYFCDLLKKVITIFFLIIYLFSVTEARQLLKLPIVFQHFAEHQTEDKNISFFHFLGIHYLHGSPMDKDHDRDMELPFKTTSAFVLSVVPVLMADVQSTTLSPLVFIISNDFLHTNDRFISSEFECNIFQPPRV